VKGILSIVFIALCPSASNAILGAAGGNKEVAKAMRDKTAALFDIKSEGRPAFRLRVRFRAFGMRSGDVEGTYLLEWVGPDRFRAEITLANFHEIQVVAGGKLWRSRSLPFLPLPAMQIAYFMNVSNRIRPNSKDRLGKISQTQLNGSPVRCLPVRGDGVAMEWEYCEDAATGLPARLKLHDVDGWTEYGEFVAFGGKFFPRVFRLVSENTTQLEGHVELLEEMNSPPADLFTPPPGAEAEPSCREVAAPQMITPLDFQELGLGLGSTHFSVYGVVGKDGVLHHAALLEVPKGIPEKKLLDAISRMRFRPATCKGVPIEKESIFRFGFSVMPPR